MRHARQAHAVALRSALEEQARADAAEEELGAARRRLSKLAERAHTEHERARRLAAQTEGLQRELGQAQVALRAAAGALARTTLHNAAAISAFIMTISFQFWENLNLPANTGPSRKSYARFFHSATGFARDSEKSTPFPLHSDIPVTGSFPKR